MYFFDFVLSRSTPSSHSLIPPSHPHLSLYLDGNRDRIATSDWAKNKIPKNDNNNHNECATQSRPKRESTTSSSSSKRKIFECVSQQNAHVNTNTFRRQPTRIYICYSTFLLFIVFTCYYSSRERRKQKELKEETKRTQKTRKRKIKRKIQ